MRTTLDIDEPVLRDLKRLSKERGRSMGRVASDLLAQAMAADTTGEGRGTPFHWNARRMGARVELADKEALYGILDREVDGGQAV